MIQQNFDVTWRFGNGPVECQGSAAASRGFSSGLGFSGLYVRVFRFDDLHFWINRFLQQLQVLLLELEEIPPLQVLFFGERERGRRRICKAVILGKDLCFMESLAELTDELITIPVLHEV
ncbi:hypothetical protein M5K25_005989 [Dendrobium thyrsiflorum]|uniref:Uncharacterized protein n=1 Tax=Dendrobium thyrsiflorum TaxID=117978 RepID=A0ABD0VAM1_DENTH